MRSDPHSSFAYGFELGNLRLCQQVLMFHHFPEELGNAHLLTQRQLLEYAVTALSYNMLATALPQAWDGTDLRQLDQCPALRSEYSEFIESQAIFVPLE
ncbi:SpvB/TcaC N-terminal domain-containing protein, partial [Pseudomonas viridiflava]|uniref:SpvB/TcaC N-terminal domain-containing protein n=1 Tax=Pseudomonas viridiflava TaxID=33069 RepID=UPI003F6DD82B